ncbi:conjugal transfer protein TraK [Deltaproteobacteria bacterium Smac51]|nr:conjugal transfer protein TraK [Deltaproteobacteria bacterium Smac51]
MSEASKKRLSFARIEYRAVKTFVEQRLEEGYSLKLIFEELTESGQVTMSYTAFCDYVRGCGSRVHGKKKAKSALKKMKPAGKDEPFRVEKQSLEELVYGTNDGRLDVGRT